MKDPQDEFLDQTLHFLVAFVVVAFATLGGGYPTAISGAIVGFSLGAVREVTERGSPFSRGSARDLLFWTLGGLASGYLF